MEQPGKGAAVASLVLGILSCITALFGVLFLPAIIAIICGIAGIICAACSKRDGFDGGLRVGGLILSILGLVLGGVIFIGCVICVGGGIAALSDIIYSNKLYSVINE